MTDQTAPDSGAPEDATRTRGPAGPPPPYIPGPTAPPPPRPDFLQELRSLRRSRRDKVIAGVCGGIAERLGLDPILVRVVTVALAFFGGVGVLIYLLGWLLLPVEGGQASIVESAFGRRAAGHRPRSLLFAALLLFATLGVATTLLDGSFDGAVLVVLTVVALYVLLRRDGQPSPSTYAGPQWGSPEAAPPATATTGPVPTDSTTRPIRTESAATGPLPPVDDTRDLPTPTPQTAPAWYDAPPPPPQPPRPVWSPQAEPPARLKNRSRLFAVVMSLVLVLVGLIALADANGAGIGAAAYVALPLAVVGLGLLVGAWYGRSRGLIAVGTLLALALPVATAVDEVVDHDGRTAHVDVVATTIAEGTGSHDYGAGEVRYDLRALDFTGLDEELSIDLAIGSVDIILPPNVDVDVDVSVGLGDVNILDRETSSGFGLDASVSDRGRDGSGGGRLSIRVDSGAADVEVTRAAA